MTQEPGIIHVDMDAFYASVEERDDPRLRGRPMVVGGRPRGRGVVAAANYAARKFGIHSAMPAARALRLCPQLVFVAPRHGYYAEVSQHIRAILARYTPLVEPLSLDEAFLDVSASRALFGSTVEIGRRIKREIAAELALTASVGIAPNKFVAKVASDLGKPDGFVAVAPDEVQAFLDPLPVSRLWGVGRIGARLLAQRGLTTIAEVRQRPARLLTELFGSCGEQLWALAHGIDERAVEPQHEAKSISHETTFADDLHDAALLRAWLLELTEQVASRLRRHGLSARTVQVKIRFADFRTLTRARTLSAPTDITRELRAAAAALLERHLPAAHRGVRLLGMGVSGLTPRAPLQGDLFDAAGRAKFSRLDATADAIKARFGSDAMRRGIGGDRGRAKPPR